MTRPGSLYCRYTYDTWGNLKGTYDYYGNPITSPTHVGNINPIRYRGYFYDSETGFYYLQSRYYDPEIGRFISMDDVSIVTLSPEGLTDKNLFAYCDNNPVVRLDNGGAFWDTFFDAVSLAMSIADVIQNPSDPMAWASLAADTVCFLAPGMTGGGMIVKAIGKADDVVDAVKTVKKADKALDAAKATKKGWKLGDDVATLTKAGNTPSWSTVRQRFWKNKALNNASEYSADNLARMKKGLAPIGDDKFSMELHHPFGRQGDNFFNFEPVTRSEHIKIHKNGGYR